VAPRRDYYAILQLSRNASQEEIDKAYERLSRSYDPATSRKPRAAQRHAEVQEAFDVLGDRAKRREYDRESRKGEPAAAGSALPSDVLTNRFIIGAGAALVASVIAIVLLVIFVGGDGDETPVIPTVSVTPTALPTLPAQTPGVAPTSPPELDADILEKSVELPSGLIYIDIVEGFGDEAQTGEMVAINYSGWLEETGELFDTTVDKTTAARVVLGSSDNIDGWNEGIPGMREGGERRLIIPPELAYGAEGNSDLGIPPDAPLIYDITLVDILAPLPTPTPSAAPTAPAQTPGLPPASPPEVDGDEIETESGLIYIDVEEGSGDEAMTGDRVAVNYSGWLQDTGVLFDSSIDSPTAYTVVMGAGGVIPGWEEGLVGMKEGGIRRLIIPPDLAYGVEGQGEIPPNATLIFDIELVDILARGPTPSPTLPAQTPGTPADSPPEVSGEEVELSSGLVYIDFVEGTGATARRGDRVAVNYTGWLASTGERFDSSVDDNTTFNVLIGAGGVIQGWEQGLPGMKEGGKRRLMIPASLAYGSAGQGDTIPPNADLIFDIELVDILESQ
jgi:peptidylprolyl isomerase